MRLRPGFAPTLRCCRRSRKRGLAAAAKDISQGGLVGTAMMLAECSRVGADIDVARVPKPEGVPLERWLQTFPSFGFLLAVRAAECSGRDGALSAIAALRRPTSGNSPPITAWSSGTVEPAETIWDFAREPLIGCARDGGVRMSQTLRVAILAHSTNPRGGVVHALELGDALSRLGHEATVFAPDATGAGFFRETLCAHRTRSGFAGRARRDGDGRDAHRRLRPPFRTPGKPALRRLACAGRHFGKCAGDSEGARPDSPALPAPFIMSTPSTTSALRALQQRAIEAADHLFVVSRLWRDWLAREFGRDAWHVGNGVDTKPLLADAGRRPTTSCAPRLDLRPGAPVFLAVGGVEERKNTIRLLQAFQTLRLQHPSSRLVIAGGASLLDHDAYQARFAGMLAHGGGIGRRGDPDRAVAGSD